MEGMGTFPGKSPLEFDRLQLQGTHRNYPEVDDGIENLKKQQ